MKIRSLTAALAGLVLFAAPSPAGAKSKNDADLAELQNYRLTERVLKKLAQVQDSIYASIKADPGLATRYEKKTALGNESLDQSVRRIESIPELKEAIVKAGLTPREFFVAGMALAQAAFASMARDQGNVPAAVRANMSFLKTHEAELTQMQKVSSDIKAETDKATAKAKKEQADTAEDKPAGENR